MENQRYKDNLIVNLSFQLALDVIKYSEQLQRDKKFVMADQIYRCGTSIGSNICEAQNCESKRDFIHKLKISAKESDELAYRLALCNNSEGYPKADKLIEQQISVARVLNKIIVSCRQKTNSKPI